MAVDVNAYERMKLVRVTHVSHAFTVELVAGLYRICIYIYICNSNNMGTRDLPDIYAQARGHIYQENPECPRYN